MLYPGPESIGQCMLIWIKTDLYAVCRLKYFSLPETASQKHSEIVFQQLSWDPLVQSSGHIKSSIAVGLWLISIFNRWRLSCCNRCLTIHCFDKQRRSLSLMKQCGWEWSRLAGLQLSELLFYHSLGCCRFLHGWNWIDVTSRFQPSAGVRAEVARLVPNNQAHRDKTRLGDAVWLSSLCSLSSRLLQFGRLRANGFGGQPEVSCLPSDFPWSC